MEATVVINLLGDGDVQVLVDATNVDADDVIEIDLTDRLGDTCPIKWRLHSLKADLVSGTGTNLATELRRRAASADDYAKRDDLVIPDDVATRVSHEWSPPTKVLLQDRALWLTPIPDSGADNAITAELLLTPGWA